MSDIHEKVSLAPTDTVKRAIEVMTGPEAPGMILVRDKAKRLIGVVVDSDIRRGLLRGLGLEAPLSKVMNAKPQTLPHTISNEDLVRFFRKHRRASVPLVDAKGRVRKLVQMADYVTQASDRPNWVVLLVGGAGTRLYPLTANQPKPLLPVGDKPLLETIIEQFASAGFKNFALAVNHQADQIRKHFGTGKRLDVNIRYLEEKQRLGTAGPLSLIKQKPDEPIVVMNGDLLTKVDFRTLLDFHAEEKNLATVCVREYDLQIPFGVIEMEGHKLKGIVEKPMHRCYVNAGIYVLDPKVLSWIPKDRYFEMPELLEIIRRRKSGAVGCFPIREYWIDIGRIPDYERANAEFSKFF